ncbi:MAG TPA: DUF465 domain-containing protein, partial [Allocoleopsis sp.]
KKPVNSILVRKDTAMDMITVESLKEELIKENQAFRELAIQHQNYEKRLSELAGLTYPNDEELLEESVLKKKKLAVKDEMYAMIQHYSNAH